MSSACGTSISGQTLWTVALSSPVEGDCCKRQWQTGGRNGIRQTCTNSECRRWVSDSGFGCRSYRVDGGSRFDPDGRLVAASGGHTIKIWDVSTASLVKTLPGHEQETNGIAFNSDGSRIASGGNDKKVRVWDVRTGKELYDCTLNGGVERVHFSPDGRVLAADTYQQLVLYDAASGQTLRTLPTRAFGFGIDFDSTGKVAMGGDDGALYVWDVATGKELHRLAGRNMGCGCRALLRISGGSDRQGSVTSIYGIYRQACP